MPITSSTSTYDTKLEIENLLARLQSGPTGHETNQLIYNLGCKYAEILDYKNSILTFGKLFDTDLEDIAKVAVDYYYDQIFQKEGIVGLAALSVEIKKLIIIANKIEGRSSETTLEERLNSHVENHAICESAVSHKNLEKYLYRNKFGTQKVRQLQHYLK